MFSVSWLCSSITVEKLDRYSSRFRNRELRESIVDLCSAMRHSFSSTVFCKPLIVSRCLLSVCDGPPKVADSSAFFSGVKILSGEVSGMPCIRFCLAFAMISSSFTNFSLCSVVPKGGETTGGGAGGGSTSSYPAGFKRAAEALAYSATGSSSRGTVA